MESRGKMGVCVYRGKVGGGQKIKETGSENIKLMVIEGKSEREKDEWIDVML